MKIRNNKGLTLIEVLTVIVISGILLAMVATLFYSFTSLYQQLDHQNEVMNDLVLLKKTISTLVDENNNSTLEVDVDYAPNTLIIISNKTSHKLTLTEEGLFYQTIASDQTWDDEGISSIRYISNPKIERISFSLNTNETILKCKIEYKSTYNKSDLNSHEFVKILRCSKIAIEN